MTGPRQDSLGFRRSAGTRPRRLRRAGSRICSLMYVARATDEIGPVRRYGFRARLIWNPAISQSHRPASSPRDLSHSAKRASSTVGVSADRALRTASSSTRLRRYFSSRSSEPSNGGRRPRKSVLGMIRGSGCPSSHGRNLRFRTILVTKTTYSNSAAGRRIPRSDGLADSRYGVEGIS